MNRLRLLIMLLGLVHATVTSADENTFQVLAYHDVRDDVADDVDTDQYAISTANLIDHFTWLRINGYNVVSADDIRAATRGGPDLPERAVLLSFDDGFQSVATRVLPLLELFDYPAVVSVVTDWIEGEPGTYQDGLELTAEDFLSWEQIRELSEHELIEIASHSHAMHRGIVGNPENNEQPAAVTARYVGGRYESLRAYAARIRADLTRSISLLESRTGRRPRIVTWPFGAYNEITLEIAEELGVDMTLTLADGTNSAEQTRAVARHLIEGNPGVDDIGWSLMYPMSPRVVRAAQVDLDYVYDPDPAQQARNLDRLLDRIQSLEISHVFLQAFADPDADGGAQALYFPNRYLPMRADLFNRTAWQLTTRANVIVYAWLPLLSFEGDGIDPAWRVQQLRDGELVPDPAAEPRLSPFSAEATDVIHGIYEDLARHASFAGILFHDDGRFNEFEDFSAAAMTAYRARFGPDFAPAMLESDPELRRQWSRLRSDALTDLSLDLAATVRRFRPGIRTARNLFATALLEPEAERFLAQDFESYLETYDYVAIMAMPRFENYPNHREFYARLTTLAQTNKAARDKVIFQLQTVDWPAGTPIDSVELRETMRELQALGIRNLAYYPDDFIQGHPELKPLHQGLSIGDHPGMVPR